MPRQEWRTGWVVCSAALCRARGSAAREGRRSRGAIRAAAELGARRPSRQHYGHIELTQPSQVALALARLRAVLIGAPPSTRFLNAAAAEEAVLEPVLGRSSRHGFRQLPAAGRASRPARACAGRLG